MSFGGFNTRLNGEEMQRATIDDLIFGVPELMAYITTFTELVPGGQTLADVVAEVAASAAGVRAVAVSHRVGILHIGDAALVAAVAADHRGAAFETCARLVDRVKESLPVWKHQFFADGTDEWVNSA